jgi:hypothetical protein
MRAGSDGRRNICLQSSCRSLETQGRGLRIVRAFELVGHFVQGFLRIGCGVVFEPLLVDGHHLYVRCGLAVQDAFFVDLGPAEAKEQALYCDFGIGCGCGEALGLVGSHGPELGCTRGGGRLGEAAAHGNDRLTPAEYLVSGGAEEVLVVGQAGLHPRLFDGEEGDEAALFGGGPYGLGWGEVTELGRADGAWQAGRGR